LIVSSDFLIVIKFAAYVVAGFSGVVALHAIVPPVTLGLMVALAVTMLSIIGLTKQELPPYAVVSAAMIAAFILGVR
jgi:hypothetical protein